jgi:hypothetical protein
VGGDKYLMGGVSDDNRREYFYERNSNPPFMVKSSNDDLDYSFVKSLAKKPGYKVTGEFLDNGYIVETEPGEEEKVGAEFVDNYPEFFGGYEREDVKNTHIYDECDSIISDIEEIRDSVGNLNKYGKSVLSDDWNQNIDEVIKRLEKLKH